jgi:outer membrane protein OmpA-like peptidoglycan-associated protein
MKKLIFGVLVFLFVLSVNSSVSGETDIVSLYKGSELVFDDDIGFETHYYMADEAEMKTIDGNMRRQFCLAPKGVSPFEIVKNYEKAIVAKNGTIIHFSRNAYSFTDATTNERVLFMRDYFTNGRETRYNHYGYMQISRQAKDYVAGKISTDSCDLYISVAAAVVEDATYYTIVTLRAEPMDMNNVTLNVLNEGIAGNGKVAIYDIYFDTGKYDLKPESGAALKTIAAYLSENPEKKFLITGHTDNTGSFDSNIELSKNRAKAVTDELISKFKIKKEQLKAYGVGPASPVTTNSSKDGRARNRRVELVEM